MLTPQKITINLLQDAAIKEAGLTKWNFPLTLRGKTSDVSIKVFDTPIQKTSEKTGNTYSTGAEIIIPVLQKVIPMFYSEQYNSSSAKIGSDDEEIKIGLYKKGEGFKDKWIAKPVSDVQEYNLVFRFNVEETTTTEMNFGSDVVITETTVNSPLEIPATEKQDNDLPF